MNDFDSMLGIAFLKCNLFLAIVWIAWYATPVTSLRARVGLWRVAIVGAMLLLVASLTTPTLRLPLLPNTQHTARVETKRLQNRPVETSLGELASDNSIKPSPAVQPEHEKAGEQENRVSNLPATASSKPSQWVMPLTMPGPMVILYCVWGIGSIFFGVRLLRQWRYHAWLLTKSSPADTSEVDKWYEELTLPLGRTRQVRPTKLTVRWTSELKTAAVSGAFSPVILLPESWQKDDAEKIHAALAHELAHIQSRDVFWSTLIELFHAIVWPSPLVWGIAAVHRRACERLADYQAWNAIGDRSNYRSQLAGLALEMMGCQSPLAVSMVRTPQILDRLQLLENSKANVRLGVRNKAIRLAVLTLGLFVGSATLVPQPAILQAGAATDETQEPEKKSQANSQAVDANNKALKPSRITFRRNPIAARETIKVLNPDGTPANDTLYLVAPRFTDLQLDEPEKAKVQPKPLPGNSELKLDGLPKDQYLAVWNEAGYCNYAVSRLAEMDSLKLQPWCKLTVHLREGQQPLKSHRILARLNLTSNGMYQLASVVASGITDDNGDLEFERLPPGELEIFAEPLEPDRSEVHYQRRKYLMVMSGETQELTMGAEGSGITGQVLLPQGADESTYANLMGYVINEDTADWLTFSIGRDGKFETDRIPNGKCRIVIRSFMSVGRQHHFDSKTFTLPSEARDVNGRHLVDNLDLGTNPTRDPNRRRIDLKSVPIEDQFTSPEKVAWVAVNQAAGERIYVLRSASGQVIRRLEDAFENLGFGRNRHNMAIDLARDRLYLLATSSSGEYSLLALELCGKKIYSILLQPSAVALTLDEDTGNIWVNCSESDGRTTTLVFENSGKLANRFSYDDGAAISFSRVDKAIWMSGQKKIQKLDRANGKVLVSFDLPEGSWNCTASFPSPRGGVFVFEQNHPGVPTSHNRIWYLDSDGKAKMNLELDDFWVTNAGLVQNELWISGSQVNWLLSKNLRDRGSQMICFDMELNQVNDVDYPYQLLHADQDAKAAWLRHGEEDLHVTYDADRKLKILGRVAAVK